MLIKPAVIISSGIEVGYYIVESREMQTEAKVLEDKESFTIPTQIKEMNLQTDDITKNDKDVETNKVETREIQIDQEFDFECESMRTKLPIKPQKIRDKDDFKAKEYEEKVKDTMDKTSGVGKLNIKEPEKEPPKPMRKSGKRVIRESPFAKKNTQKDDSDSRSTNSGFRRNKTQI